MSLFVHILIYPTYLIIVSVYLYVIQYFNLFEFHYITHLNTNIVFILILAISEPNITEKVNRDVVYIEMPSDLDLLK